LAFGQGSGVIEANLPDGVLAIDPVKPQERG